MTRRVFLAIVLAIAGIGAWGQSWPEVKPEMKAGTRWWWMGSAVDSLNLKALIDQYAAAGIGSVEITPIYGVVGNEAREIDFLSPRWMRMLAYTEDVAAGNGMLVDMNQGTGWPFGGPEVTPDMAACKVIFLVDTVAVGKEPIKTLSPKESADTKLIAESRHSLEDDKEEVIRAYQGHTMQAVKRAAPGGEGLVLDHFNRNAVETYLDKFDKVFETSGVKWPHNFFNDSYEVYRASWTPSLFDEFEARRGYRLQDKLPELIGLVDDGNEVLADYRETLAELLLENFTMQWVDRAHRHGVGIRNQAHGSPANLIDIYAAVDVPEIEGFGLSDFGIKGLRRDPGFTRPNDSDVSMLKYASSAAHITGKPLTSSETFTWLTEHFRTSLSQMKPDLDLMFTCGVNHIFFHGTTYSPTDAQWPGWKFYASVDMSPTNTIWHDAPALMDYISRSQSMLQQGRPDNDFLVYLPIGDMWRQRHAKGEAGLLMGFSIHDMRRLAPDFISSVMEIDSLGYDCDYISDKYLMTTTFDGSQLVTAAGMPYKALIVPGSGRLKPQLKAHLDSLAAKGARIIYGIDKEAIKSAATHEELRTDLGLRAIRRRNDDGYTYFIANLSPHDIDSTVHLAIEFAEAAWFNPIDGAIHAAETSDGKIVVKLRSGESRILRTYDKAGVCKADKAPDHIASETELSHLPWTLTVDGKDYKLNGLQHWTALNDPVLNEFGGTATYTASFDLAAADSDASWQLELEDLRESARVYVNGQYVGTAWAAPFTVDFKGMLHPGSNTLAIEVTNLPANRIAAMDRRGEKWRNFKDINIVDIHYKRTDYSDWKTVDSGLTGARLKSKI